MCRFPYPRELDAGEFGEDAAAANGCPEQDFPGHVFRDGADPGSIFSAGDGADHRQDLIGGVSISISTTIFSGRSFPACARNSPCGPTTKLFPQNWMPFVCMDGSGS